MKSYLPRYSLVLLLVASLVGCTHGNQDALRAAGIGEADIEALRRPLASASICFGARSVTVSTYSPLERADGTATRVPHFAIVGAPSMWGFGPVTVWEGSRVLLWSKRDAWWVVTDLGDKQGVVLLVAYDNHGVGGPLELHLYQQPQRNARVMKWWFFVWMPPDISQDGFILRPASDSEMVRFSVEAIREGRIVTVGDVHADPASGAIKYRRTGAGSEPTTALPSEKP